VSGRKVNGEGSVYQRKDGRWVASAYVPVAGGKVRRVSSYTTTRTEANKMLRKLIEQAERDAPVAPASLTIAAFLDEWLAYVKHHVRPSTWTAYEGNSRLHIVPHIGRKKLTRLSVREVRLMLEEMRSAGVGQRTIQYVHATLRAALEHAYRDELISRNVAKLVQVERPRPNPKEPLSVEEARKLLAATSGDRHYALWVLMIMLGLRRSEVCGLRWEHIDFQAATLHIMQTVQRAEGKLRELPTKSRRSTRTVPLPPRALTALLDRHRELDVSTGEVDQPTNVYVFGTRNGTPLEPRNLSRMWTDLCKTQGIRQVPLHGLRHTCVSLLLAQGVHPRVVMEIVGHSAIEITMNVYGHLNVENQRKALEGLDKELSRITVAVNRCCQTSHKIIYRAPTWCAWRDSNPQPSDP